MAPGAVKRQSKFHYFKIEWLNNGDVRDMVRRMLKQKNLKEITVLLCAVFFSLSSARVSAQVPTVEPQAPAVAGQPVTIGEPATAPQPQTATQATIAEQMPPLEPSEKFPNPSSCVRFQNELQFLKKYYDQGVKQAQNWLNVMNQHTEAGNRWDAVVGKYISYPSVQVGGLLGGTALVIVGASAIVSTPVLIVGILAAGTATYFFWHHAVNYHDELEHDRVVELNRIDYLDLVKADQDYEQNFIWPEQVARFQRLVPLNGQSMGLPTYKGGYQQFPIQDLGGVLTQIFSYFNVHIQLLYKGYQQLEDLPQDTNWYVQLTTQRHANMVKAKMARALYDAYAFQAQLAFGAGQALAQDCHLGAGVPLTTPP